MKHSILTALCLLPLLLTGCLLFQGQSYLDKAAFDEGLMLSREALAEDPDDPQANYYAARFLLAKERYEEALPLIKHAVALEPRNADYHFWLGVTSWALFDFKTERAEYRRALALDHNHLSAHLYLGHSHLDAGEWREALREYDAVLKLYKLEPGAMFNRTVALDRLGRKKEAHSGLLDFMTAYPDGETAIRATNILQSYGDFTYRNVLLGRRTVPLRTIVFEPGSARFGFDVTASLDVLGAMMENNPNLRVHTIAYVRGNAALAQKRAERIRLYISLHFPDVPTDRLLLSWFGTGERISTASGDFLLPESVNLITEVGQRLP